MNTDDLIAQMQADEESDRIQEQTLASPVDYGKLRGVRPQLVYYHIRAGHLEVERCACGRRCISIHQADIFFGKAELDDGDERDLVD